jgi:hypothetical protein
MAESHRESLAGAESEEEEAKTIKNRRMLSVIEKTKFPGRPLNQGVRTWHETADRHFDAKTADDENSRTIDGISGQDNSYSE